MRRKFNQYAFKVVSKQIETEQFLGIQDNLSLGIIKPLIVEWCADIWKPYNASPEFHNMVLDGWNHCVIKHGNPYDKVVQEEANELVQDDKLKT